MTSYSLFNLYVFIIVFKDSVVCSFLLYPVNFLPSMYFFKLGSFPRADLHCGPRPLSWHNQKSCFLEFRGWGEKKEYLYSIFLWYVSQINILLLTNVEYFSLVFGFLYPTTACNSVFFIMLALAFNQKRAGWLR